MNHLEAGKLLAVIVAYDRRTIGETDVLAWQAALADIDWDDAHEAVINHYRHSRAWLMPADIYEPAVAAARRRAGRQRMAELEATRVAEEEADRLALDTAPAVSREELASRLQALAARSRYAVPREDPRPPEARMAEARRELDELHARTAVAANVPVETNPVASEPSS